MKYFYTLQINILKYVGNVSYTIVENHSLYIENYIKLNKLKELQLEYNVEIVFLT